MTPEIEPTDATLGATVRNVRLDALDDETFAAIEEAWHAYAVLIFPDQHLTEEVQVAFSERFGPLERSLTKTHTQGDPAIIHLSNIKKDGSLWAADSDTARLLKGNDYWHTDSSFKRIPAKGSALSARTVPKTGGETAFADMRAAYDALEPAMQDWLADKMAVHSYAYSQGKVGGMGGITDDEWDSLPPVEQPVVRTHPATGRRNLYYRAPCEPHRRRGPGREPCAPGAALCRRVPAAPHFHPQVAGGRPGHVGQPLCPAPRPRLSPRPAAPHGPHNHRRRRQRRERVGRLNPSGSGRRQPIFATDDCAGRGSACYLC